MRISTSTIFDANVTALNQNQSKMLHTQQQISSGRRILTPAEDPAAAARALEVTQADATNAQYASNIGVAQDSQGVSEGVMQTVTTLLQDIQTVAVSAGNPVMANADRAILAKDLQGKLTDLISLANSKDAVGNYLFSGFQGKTQPFVNTAAGVQYMGDDGQRMIQVSANRQLPASDSGADVFMRIKNGNGTFATQAAPANAGSGVASQGFVVNPAALTGHNYAVNFTTATTFDVYDTTLDPTMVLPPLSAGNSYVSGQAISFDGMQFDIQGAPASGDQFTVAPSSNESIFKTISDLITTLNTPTIPGNVASTVQLNAGVGKALNGLDNSLNSVLTTRASLGSRLNELDSLKTAGTDLSIQYQQTLSRLQDVDYNKAITDLTQQQTMLQAAQKSFLQVQNLSMFNFM
jgi:flagellar hook-associated protein 3 FlgL